MVNGSQKSKGKNSDLCQTLWVSRDEGDEETFFNCRPLTSGTAETPFPYDLNNLFVDPSLLALIFHLDKGTARDLLLTSPLVSSCHPYILNPVSRFCYGTHGSFLSSLRFLGISLPFSYTKRQTTAAIFFHNPFNSRNRPSFELLGRHIDHHISTI